MIDFYDSKLNPAETKNAEITACQNDVAAVGTSAVFLTSVDEMRNCKDSTGAVTGLPDIPFVSTALVQQCSDQSFPIAPPQVLCDTATDHPQTFQADVARGYYYLDKYGKDLHGVYVFGSDSKSARDASFASLGGLRDIGGVDQGIKSDEDFDLSSRATQSEYTPIVQKMKSSGSNYGQAAGPYTQMVSLRKEAALQGVTGVKVWDCGVQCYDKLFIDAGGADVEGQYSRHALPALLQQGGPEGEPDARQRRQVHRRRQARGLRHVRVGRGPRVPRRGERAGRRRAASTASRARRSSSSSTRSTSSTPTASSRPSTSRVAKRPAARSSTS